MEEERWGCILGHNYHTLNHPAFIDAHVNMSHSALLEKKKKSKEHMLDPEDKGQVL